MKLTKKLWIVIPGHNEAPRIENIIVTTKQYTQQIIVVNDGSTDATSALTKKQGVIVLDHLINMGKGAALKTGCDYALSKGAEIIIVMDADGQHLPQDIPRLVEKMLATDSDIVYTYRILNKTMPEILKFGNRVISWITNLLYKVNVRDSQCGFRCFTADAYKKIRWNAYDYCIESEMIARAGKNNLKYAEIPIQTIYLDKYKGTTVLDGIKVVAYMLWWRVST